MKDWKKYFFETAIDLGYSYFLKKQVNDFQFNEKGLTATITNTGVDSYKAVITINKEVHLEEMTCNCLCPSNEQCSHLAATLFVYDHYLQKENINNIEQLISHANELQIHHFLHLLLSENKLLAQRFQHYIYSEVSFESKKTATHSGKQQAVSSIDEEETVKEMPKKRKAHPLSVKQMAFLNYSTKKIRQFTQDNWEFPTIRSQYVDYLLQHRLYEEAENVLKESIALDSSSPHLVLLHRYSLKNLYLELGRKQDYFNQMIELLTENKTLDMRLIQQLKKNCTAAEWDPIRNHLFKELRNHSGIDLFYAQEKRYDLLLDYILEIPGLKEVDRYFERLKSQTPDALLQKYEYELRKMAYQTTTRSTYQKMAYYIEKMATLPNSTLSVQLLIKELIEKYPRRKAMIQVLHSLEKRL